MPLTIVTPPVGADVVMPAGYKPCEAGAYEMVVDYKGVLALPFDTDNDAIKCVRALIFAKGKAIHVPTVSGQYVTTAPYTLVTAPCLVHFALSSRPPELCISFMDFAATNGGLAGVVVESLMLPLKLQGKDKYRTLPNLAQANTVVGFSPIPSGDATINLTATLKGISPFKHFGVSTLNEVNRLVGQPLAVRISKMKDHALARILSQVTAIAKAGDAAAAAERQGLWAARLEWIVNIMTKLPPINYDARLESRVTVLEVKDGEQLGHRPDWLASPLKQQLMLGASGALQRSRFVEQQPKFGGAAAAAATAALEPGAGEAAALAAASIAAAAGDKGDDDSVHSFQEHDDAVMEVVPLVMDERLVDDSDNESGEALPEVLPATRKRKTPAACMPGGASLKRGKAIADKAAKGKAAAKCSASNSINPRSKEPYKRGPYSAREEQKVPKAPKIPVSEQQSEAIKTLQAELTIAKDKIKDLEMKLEIEKSTSAANVLSAKNEMLAKMSSEAMDHFMRGLNHGSMLSGGKLRNPNGAHTFSLLGRLHFRWLETQWEHGAVGGAVGGAVSGGQWESSEQCACADIITLICVLIQYLRTGWLVCIVLMSVEMLKCAFHRSNNPLQFNP